VTLAHPYRLTPGGTAATVAPGSARHAAQLAGHVLSTSPGERGLAPQFGLPDPAGGPLDESVIAATIAVCTPDLDVRGITLTDRGDGTIDVTITVTWAGDPDA
jgi:hypothetical protein